MLQVHFVSSALFSILIGLSEEEVDDEEMPRIITSLYEGGRDEGYRSRDVSSCGNG